ncbi:MAG: NADH-quinone oxidoreductase subunit C [Nitrospirae bacterium]|nr:NADH-quinone oxidoreductase subunit C [Nitrospirota bacterium]
MNEMAERIQSRFPEGFIGAKEFAGDIIVNIRKGQVLDILRFLNQDPDLDFDMMTEIITVDYPEDNERFEVVYQIYSTRKMHRIRVKARVKEDDSSIDSVTGIWKGADFMEREAFDMMGIRFNNHPDLRRILMPEDYDEGYPLRKDFPIKGKGWRHTYDFIPKMG